MSVNRFRKQPQYAAPLDRGSPSHRYIAFAYSAGRGLQDGKHTGVIGASVGTITHRYGSGGRYITPADGSSYVQFPSVDDYNVLGNITVIARVRLGTIGTQQAIAIKSASSGGIDTPFALLIESDGSVSLNRSNNAGGPSFRVWSSSAKLSAGQTAVIAATQPTDISTPPKFYIDGSFDTGAASSLYGGAGVGAAGSTTSPVQLGNRTDLASRFYGNIFDVIIFNDVFSRHAIDGLSRDIDQIWRAPPRKIWASLATTTHDLTGAGQIASAEAVQPPSVSADVAAAGLASAEAIGSVALQIAVDAAGITSAQAFGTPAVDVAAPAEITGIGQITTAEALGSPALGADITAAGVESAEVFGSVALASAIDVIGLASAEAVGTPEVGGDAPADIAGVGQIATTEALGAPTLAISITTAGIESREAFGAAALAVAIADAGSIATAEAVGAPAVVEAGPAEITSAGGIGSAEAFGAALIGGLVPYTGTGFQVGSGHRRPRLSRELPQIATAHRLGLTSIESQERLGYPALKWRGRSRKVRDEEFLLGRTA